MSASIRLEWIALADAQASGPLTAALASGHLQATADPDAFERLLLGTRPRVAIVVAPPATRATIEGALRERRRRPSLRLIHLSPPDAIVERVDALRAGFDEALPSTVSPVEVLARVRLHDELARTTPDRAMPVGAGVVLDPIAHEVRRAGRPLRLRPKEFDLLSMLAAHPGRAYTRRQLLDRVWGVGHDSDSRTVDVHVRWLRSKIEPRPARPVHLVTVRGVGYRLDPHPDEFTEP